MATGHVSKPIQMSGRLRMNLRRMHTGERHLRGPYYIHVWANKVYMGPNLFPTATPWIIEGMELAGYIEEYKTHWYRLTKKGRDLVYKHLYRN